MKSLFVVIFNLLTFEVWCQLDQYQMYAGVAMYSKNEHFDSRGIDQNAFANYGPSALLGAGFSMYVNDHVRLGTNIEATSTTKQYYKMSFVSILPTLNLHILPFDKKVSPFLTGAFNVGFLNLSQAPYVYIAIPDRGYSVKDPSNPQIVKEEISRPYFSLQSQPVFGGTLGVGVDVRLKKHWGAVICINHNILFDETNNTISENLTYNKYDLSYTMITTQLRYRIF